MWLASLMALLVFAGCAGRRKWDERIGHFSLDQAIREMGPPDKMATTSDGFTVAEWLVAGPAYYTTYGGGWGARHGGFGCTMVDAGPATVMRLTFDPAHTLASYRKFSR